VEISASGSLNTTTLPVSSISLLRNKSLLQKMKGAPSQPYGSGANDGALNG
jgi:hypothetical protein